MALSVAPLAIVGVAAGVRVPPPVGPLTDDGEFTGEPPPSLVIPLPTVMLIVAEAIRPSPTSVYERTTVAVPIFAGVNVRPLRAVLRLASVPLIVIDAELLLPEVNVIPFVLPKLSVPSVAVRVSGSTAPPAPPSAILTAFLLALEKVRVEVTATVAVAGAVMVGAVLTVRATLAEAERLSTESLSEIASASEPE
jgi:hypothetical protein